ncbi:hypothetical protein CDSE_0003 [Candidatus Kinetoplastibacterium desouzaii TCC079E]|uniref:Uncharacterized protein n=1 Tax=Candidatus Kinetoplastidibacterium desouzai TCC079E TaxID=1208919 RepID=M1LSP0_9PROT|nr:hypothetical protein [Candidatus Kinetoplastibacterium desouzaii]AGF47131.1 hypothetical protein CDSE_0003 [Candidatus Kinetoplastibacterium desouzaii TCC079E]
MLQNIEKLSCLVDRLTKQFINLASENISLQSGKKYAEDELEFLKKVFAEKESELSLLKSKYHKLESLVAVLQIDIKKVEENFTKKLDEQSSFWSKKESDMLDKNIYQQKAIASLELVNDNLRKTLLEGLSQLEDLMHILPTCDYPAKKDEANEAN